MARSKAQSITSNSLQVEMQVWLMSVFALSLLVALAWLSLAQAGGFLPLAPGFHKSGFEKERSLPQSAPSSKKKRSPSSLIV